jgi:hypothetical protein
MVIAAQERVARGEHTDASVVAAMLQPPLLLSFGGGHYAQVQFVHAGAGTNGAGGTGS